MKKMIISLLFVLVFAGISSAQSSNFSISYDGRFYDNPARHDFWVGENVVIPFYCYECVVKSTVFEAKDVNNNNIKMSFSLNHNQGLSKEEEKLFCGDNNQDCITWHWRNRQSPWQAFEAKAIRPGTYKFSLNLTRKYSIMYNDPYMHVEFFTEDATIDFEFRIHSVETPYAGVPAHSSVAAILSHDTASSYVSQKEIYSRLRNNTSQGVTLNRPYMDYYMTKKSNYISFGIWNIPTNACVQVLKCDDVHYVIRHRYNQGQVYIPAGGELNEFQVGIFEASENGVDKSIRAFDEKLASDPVPYTYFDPSYLYYTPATQENYSIEAGLAAMRTSFYNYKMASYDDDGNLLYGTSPDWYGEQCRVVSLPWWGEYAPDGVTYRGNLADYLCPEDPITIDFGSKYDEIYEGEDYFALPTIKSTKGKITSLEVIEQSDFDWLEAGTPTDYWQNNYEGTNQSELGLSRFADKFYVRSINGAVRQDHNLYTGTYTYKLRATDAQGNTKTVTREVRILEGADHGAATSSGLAVLVGDETWFKRYQLDIASGIERFANSGLRELKKGYHYDYYGQLKNNADVRKNASKFHNWYTDDGVSQTLYNCGEGKYKIRYEMTGDPRTWSINFNQSLFDIKTGIVYPSGTKFDKTLDYSMAPFVKNGELELYARKYNPNVPLYDNNNNLLWGNPPSWANQCNDLVGELTHHDLAVQFRDSELKQNNIGYFDFRVINRGTKKVNLEGYQLRFFYGETSYDPSRVKFDIRAGNPAGPWSVERCRDNMYVLKINLTSYAEIEAGAFYPAENQWRMLFEASVDSWNSGINLEKQKMFSWKNTSIFNDNDKIGLFDPNGMQVYGREDLPICDGDGNGSDNGGDVVANSNLKVQFSDEQASQDYHGDFKFNVVNTGSEDVSIGGYELLFYYDDDKNPANAKFVFDAYNLEGASYSYQQCSDNKYVLKIKLKSDALVKAGKSYPENNNPLKIGAYVNGHSEPMTKSNMESWINTTVMTDDPQMSLYDANGNLVYGKSGAVCGYSDGGNDNGGNQDNDKHDIKEDEYKFSKLTAQFVDYARDVVFRGDFAFQVYNSGNKEMSIGNYEMLFYYYSQEDFDASMVRFYDGNLANSIITKEVCADGKFALRIKLDENAFVAPYGSYPLYSPITVTMDMGGRTIDKQNDIYSWTDASIMSDDSKMALYDDKGHLVFGTPRFNCGKSITVPKGETSPGSVVNNYKFTVWEVENLYDFSYQEQGENGQTENIVIKNGQAEVTLTVKNIGKIDADGPIYVEYFITHPDGQVPLLTSNGKELSTAGVEMSINDQLSVVRSSVGDRHVFIFTVKNGLKINEEVSINFKLNDNCITCVDKDEAETFFTWNVLDDWSHVPNFRNNSGSDVVENVVVLTNDLVPRYGAADPYAARYKVVYGEGNGPVVEIPGIEVQKPNPNRTDATAYSGGQLLVNGDFEEPSMVGWDLKSGTVNNIRGATTQGSRFIKLFGEICQEIPESAIELLADSAAVLSFWHMDEDCAEGQKNCNNFYVKLGNTSYDVPGSAKWFRQSVYFLKGQLNDSEKSLCIGTNSNVRFDDFALIPNTNDQPVTYAVRFTTTQHEEIESRTYDGMNKLLVKSSERDAMGRSWYKYLPFEYLCDDAKDCNSEIYTLDYPDIAKEKYIKDNPFYADAQGFPFVETKWKPDPAATKDVEGAPGKAFSLDADSKEHHVVRTYSSGVNLEGIDTTDFTSLASAVNAVRNCRVYTENECLDNAKSDDGDYNFHAAKDQNPTHTWEMTIEQNGIAAFTVKDGEGRTIVSGTMKKTSSNENGKVAYELLTRSVYELNAQGKVIKEHSPLSCDYTPKPAKCVDPSYYNYDSQNRLVKTEDPDAGITRIYYDRYGRVRATQTQNQIGTKSSLAVLYDHLNRVIATGEWKHNKKEDDLEKDLLTDETVEANKANFPSEESLIPGTITRTFYDEVPTEDTLKFLGVDIAPSNTGFDNTRGRVTAVISDVRAVFNDDGSAKKATSGADSVIRVSTANSYDKYGRVLASYSFDPTLPDDSLWILAVETEYDLGGKVLTVTKYPYGLSDNAKKRKITESYNYDRLGRVESIFAKDGSSPEDAIATYEYLPTGAVKSIKMGNALTLSYSYHISGAVKTIDVTSTREEQLYSETLYYEDCGDGECTPQYNGNISRMLHKLAHSNQDYETLRDVQYTYDDLNRLTSVADANQPIFDELFEYDVQGRITAQRRAQKSGPNNEYKVGSTGGEYTYDNKNNRLVSVADGMGGSAETRIMSATDNFDYDLEGNLTKDESRGLTITYNWRSMPIEFVREIGRDKPTKLQMSYDGTGRRVSKTILEKNDAGVWETTSITHYTGIGTEIRENFAGESPETKVVVNMPQGLGRYEIEDASEPVNVNTSRTFEWFLKNHIGSTMLVYASGYGTPGTVMAAYDYRAFGEQIELKPSSSGKITENFTGKERDDEIELNYFGARYLDPMLGMWTSVDPLREFHSGYAYGPASPINGFDSDGEKWKNVGEPTYSNVFWNAVFNFIAGVGESQNKVGRKIYYSANPNPIDIRVRHITQEWVYDPNASDEENGRHPFGTRRTIDQTKQPERFAKQQYKNLYGDGPTLGWTDNMNWTPQVFDNSLIELNSITYDYSNLYEPNGNVSYGVPIIENEPAPTPAPVHEPNGKAFYGEAIIEP